MSKVLTGAAAAAAKTDRREAPGLPPAALWFPVATKNLAATSTENSYVLNTRSNGWRKFVTTDVVSLGSLVRML